MILHSKYLDGKSKIELYDVSKINVLLFKL